MADRGGPVAQRDVVDRELRPARRQVRAGAVVEQPDVVAVLAQVLDPVLGHRVDRERAGGVAVSRSHHERPLGAHLVAGQADLGAVGGRASGAPRRVAGSRRSGRHAVPPGHLDRPVLSAVRPGLQGRTARRKSHGPMRVGYKACMQAAMDRLGSFISRRRKLVLGTWIALLVLSLPFFAMQTQAPHGRRLRGPWLAIDIRGRTRSSSSPASSPRSSSSSSTTQGRQERRSTRRSPRPSRRAKGVDGVAVIPQAEQAARAAGDQPIVLMPLQVTGSADQTRRRGGQDPQERRHPQRGSAAVPIHLVGQQALWAGMQDLSKKDLEKAEFVGFPIVFIVLLLIFGQRRRGAAAAQPRLHRRRRHRRDRLLPLAGDPDVDLRDQHRVDARHRRRGRLLAVHPRQIPGGDRTRARSEDEARTDRDADVRPRRGVLRHDRDHRAGRPVPDRLQDDALDGDRRDRRRVRADPRRRDAAAGADQDARPSRRTSRGKVVGKVVAQAHAASRKPDGVDAVLDALDEPPDEPPGALRHARHAADAADRAARASR